MTRAELEALAEPKGFRPFPMGSSQTFEVPHPEFLSIPPDPDRYHPRAAPTEERRERTGAVGYRHCPSAQATPEQSGAAAEAHVVIDVQQVKPGNEVTRSGASFFADSL